MLDENAQLMLLEERYADIRIKIRNIYEEYGILQRMIEFDKMQIEYFRSKINFFNKKRMNDEIEKLQDKINKINNRLIIIKSQIEPLMVESYKIECKFDDDQREKYDCDNEIR